MYRTGWQDEVNDCVDSRLLHFPLLLRGIAIDLLSTPIGVDYVFYAHGRRLCSNWFRHGSTATSYPQCSLTFMREHCLHRCREQSLAIRAYAVSAVGIDVVSVHKLFE